MVTYNNKLVTVLSGYNVVQFANETEFNEFKNILMSIGCDVSKYEFNGLLKDVKRFAEHTNSEYEFGNDLVAGWDNKYGFQYGWKDIHACIRSFDDEPFTWKEIKEDLV